MNKFLCIGANVWGIWAHCPQLAQSSKYTKTGVALPSHGLYPWVRLHLMWSVEFNTFDDFLCISADDLGYLCQISPTCPNFANTQEQVSIEP